MYEGLELLPFFPCPPSLLGLPHGATTASSCGQRDQLCLPAFKKSKDQKVCEGMRLVRSVDTLAQEAISVVPSSPLTSNPPWESK